MEYRIGALIFSRLSSKRLPNKALKNINGSLLIQLVINAVKKINSDIHVIATSDNNEDKIFEEIANSNHIKCFRGELNNVAKRTLDCIEKYELDYFIRINGDSPIIPIDLINNAIAPLNLRNKPDLITNIFPRSFPFGYSIEIIKSSTFKEQYKNFENEQLEHITSYFYKNYTQFKIQNITSHLQLTEPIELTVDDQKGLEQIRAIFNKNPDIQTKSIEEIVNIYNNKVTTK